MQLDFANVYVQRVHSYNSAGSSHSSDELPLFTQRCSLTDEGAAELLATMHTASYSEARAKIAERAKPHNGVVKKVKEPKVGPGSCCGHRPKLGKRGSTLFLPCHYALIF